MGRTRSSLTVSTQGFVYTECVFEWEARKAAANLVKHDVSFDEAATIFVDADALDGPDTRHSDEEARFLRLGRSAVGRVLMVAYTLRKVRRCRNDPRHQRTAGEPPRKGLVRGERLISRTSRRHRRHNFARCDASAARQSASVRVS